MAVTVTNRLNSVETKIDTDGPFCLILEYKPSTSARKTSDKVDKQSSKGLKLNGKPLPSASPEEVAFIHGLPLGKHKDYNSSCSGCPDGHDWKLYADHQGQHQRLCTHCSKADWAVLTLVTESPAKSDSPARTTDKESK